VKQRPDLLEREAEETVKPDKVTTITFKTSFKQL